jgi:hypothetical protein
MKQIIVIGCLSLLAVTSPVAARDYEYDPVREAYENFWWSWDTPDWRVQAMQQRLTEQGYYRGAIDGTMNPAFQRSVWNYQRAKPLPSSGALDEATVVAIEGGTAAGAASPPTR